VVGKHRVRGGPDPALVDRELFPFAVDKD